MREDKEWRKELGTVVSSAGARLSVWRLVKRPSAAAAELEPLVKPPASVLLPQSSVKQVRLLVGKLLRIIGLQNMESLPNCCRY